MDLAVIGAHCEAERCGDLDFLPIKCTQCYRVFCRHHVPLDAHSCPGLEANLLVGEGISNLKRERCAFGVCQKPSLESVIVDKTNPEHRTVATCPQCSGAFCATHRHPSDHECKVVPTTSSPSQKNLEAHELLAKHFPASSSKMAPASSKASTPPTDPKKMARRRAVQLMKMRHHAVPADPKDKTTSVPLNQRVHVKVLSSGTTATSDQIFWLRKTVVTGRALDLIADQMSVRITDNMPVYLDKLPESGAVARLQNDKLLCEQIDDGETLIWFLGAS